MSSPAAHQVAGAPASQPIFPDEILEEIFLRLDAGEDLVRASAACTTFRRVVSARRFLDRFRPHYWRVCDARDSRVLLRRVRVTTVLAGLVVCDPLHRRHVELPAIPDKLAAATGCRGLQEFDPFLDPDTGKDKEKQDLSFRVICAVQCEHMLVTFDFSSVTGQWRGMTFNRPVPLNDTSVRFPKLFERHYAHSCYFWTIALGGNFMFMLNMHDLELSVVDLPPGVFCPREQAIVEAGEDMIGLFNLSDGMLQLYYKSLRGTEWHHERIIPLPRLNSYWSILDAAAGHLLLQATPQDCSPYAKPESQYFTLNLKTFLVEGLCVSNRHITGAHLYASFLLPLSQPSI